MQAPTGRTRRSRRAALLAVALAIAGVAALTLVDLPTGPPPPRSAARGALRVVAANLALDNTSADAAGAALAELEADVLVVLEWTGSNAGTALELDRGLHVVLDHARPNAHGVLVLVREPLEAEAALEPTAVPGPCPLPVATVRLRLGATRLSVLGVHAPPPIEGCYGTNEPTLRWLGSLVAGGRLVRDLGAAREGDPVVLAGDFNALPGSAAMAALARRGLIDAHAESRLRPVGTWTGSPAVPHLARIDYVLVPEGIAILGSWTVHLPGSDHRAVVADLAPPGRERVR